MSAVLLLVGAIVIAAGAVLWLLLWDRKPATTDDLPADRIVGDIVYRAFRIPATARVEAFTDALDLTLDEAASWDPKTEKPPPAIRARQQERYRNHLIARKGKPSRVQASEDCEAKPTACPARPRIVSPITTATRRTTLPGTQPHRHSRPPLKTVGHYPLGGVRELPNFIIGDAPGVERRCSCGERFTGSADDVAERWEAHLHADERTFGSKAADRVFAWLEKRQEHVQGRAASVGKARSLLKATSLLSVLFFLALSIDAGRSGRWNHDFKDPLIRSIAEAARSVGATGSAITANTGAQTWGTNGAWVGAVQPTAADDVTIPNTSTVTIASGTTALCRSINVQAGGTVVWASTTSELDVGDASGGAFTVATTGTLTLTGVGLLVFKSTSNNGGSGWSINTNGIAAGHVLPRVRFDGAGGKWVAGGAMTVNSGSNVTLTNGTFDTGNFSQTWGTFGLGVGTKTLTLGSASVTINGTGTSWDAATNISGFALSAGTSTITLTGAGVTFNGQGLTYYSASFSGSGTITLNGGNTTFTNLIRSGTAVKTDGFVPTSTMVVTGTLTLGGNTTQGVNRLLVTSQTVGTQRSITCNGAAVVINGDVDFQDFAIAGLPSWTNSGSAFVGDIGGNNSTISTNATVAATQTHTASAGGNWSDATKWTSRVPLPQDNVVVNASTTGTLTFDMVRLGASIDFTGFAGTTQSGSGFNVTICGSLTLASGMTWNNSTTTTLAGRGSYTLTSAGKQFTGTLTFAAPSGTYTLSDAVSSAAAMSVTDGTLATADFSTTSTTFVANSGRTLVVNFGISVVTLTSTAAQNVASFNGGATTTLSASTATFVISVASANTRTFAGGGKTFGTLTYTVAGSTGQLTIASANNVFAVINFSDASNARTLILPASTTTTVTTFNVQGLVGKRMTVNSSSGGTAATLTLSAMADCAYCDFQDITATTSPLVARRGRNVSGNTGITFPTIPVFDAAAAGAFSVSTASLTFSATVNAGTNRMLRVGVSLLNAASQTVTGITYGGVAMTVAGTVANGTGARGEMWYLVNPAVGTANVVVTLSAAAAVSAGGDSWSNVDQGAPIGLWTTATGTGTGPTVTVVSSSLEQVLDVATTAAADLSAGPGQTADWDNGVAGVTGAGSREAGATSTVMSWTSTLSGLWAIGAAPVFGALVVSTNLAGSSTPVGTVVDTVKKFLAGSETPAGAVKDTASKPLAGSTTPSGALKDTAVKVASGSTTPSGALIDTVKKFLSGAETPTGSLTDTVSRSFSGSETPTGVVVKTPSKPLAGSETPTGALRDTAIKAAGGSVTPSGGIVQTADKGLSGSVTPSGQVRDTVAKSLAGSETPAGVVAKTASTHMAGNETPTGAMKDTPVKALSGTESPSGAVVRTADKVFSGTETPSGSVTKNASIHLSGSETPTGSVARTLVRKFAGSLTPSGILHTTPMKAFSGVLAPIGHLLLEAVHFIRDRRSCEVPTPTSRRNQTVIPPSDRHNQP